VGVSTLRAESPDLDEQGCDKKIEGKGGEEGRERKKALQGF